MKLCDKAQRSRATTFWFAETSHFSVRETCEYSHENLMQNLMDAAFIAAKDAPGQSTAEGRQEIKAELARLFPQCSSREIAAAYRQARALLNACYEIGDLRRAEILTHNEAVAKLAREFSSFSRAVYERAVGCGMFISR